MTLVRGMMKGILGKALLVAVTAMLVAGCSTLKGNSQNAGDPDCVAPQVEPGCEENAK